MNKVIDFINNNNLGAFKENVSFKNLTTYRCGGNAKLVYFPNCIPSLITFLKFAKEENIEYKVFGNGSNILASDDNYDGIIIKLNNLDKYKLDEETSTLEVEAGCGVMILANLISKMGYSGLEFACGIPGTIGGAVYMNAGAYLKSFSDILVSATLLDNNFNIIELTNEELEFSYRKSILSDNKYIVLSAQLKLEKKDVEEITKIINERLHRRIDSQPLEYPSAGSVFRNPEGDFAGRLIEECNLKGMMYGGAEISGKHANFIINKENAKSSDIKYLMELAQKKVEEKFDIKLHREQELFNFK